jgi:hypothetical protein
MPNDHLPTRLTTPIVVGVPTERERRAIAARRQAEDGLLSATLQGHFTKEATRIEHDAAADATKSFLEGELELLAWATAKANGSAAAAKLVGDRVEQLNRIGSSILSRRFGL